MLKALAAAVLLLAVHHAAADNVDGHDVFVDPKKNNKHLKVRHTFFLPF